MRRILFTGLSAMTILFFLITFLTLPKFQHHFFQLPLVDEITESVIFSDALFTAMSTEIPLLETTLESNDIEKPDWPKLLLESASGVSPRNFTSLLDLALPGRNPEVHLPIITNEAGEETMPIESPPPDFEELLKEEPEEEKQPDSENRTNQQEAEIYVYHSHSWEAFLPLLGEDKQKPSQASSTDNTKNIVVVGSLLTEQLEKRGIPTFHDRTNVTAALHERGWDYYDSYRLSRSMVEEAMASNDRMKYFIDIHRDAQRKDITTVTINDNAYAKLYFVVGAEHKNYKENLAFVEKLNAKLETKYPGISRGIFLKDRSDGNGVYNQDLSKKSILIEVGGVDNNKEELSNTSKALGEVIGEYYHNAEEVTSEN
ncbi:stage II sporulation protein P [Virgibacillus pantothenticus]|uniref:stage II sporulation protein P n=1 Tax=Virgibacillus pantothenticus TaxID=1473 RepID=UPI0009861EC5|nr:stage II sporulation protein P [Virgibacillus pantothenticus]